MGLHKGGNKSSYKKGNKSGGRPATSPEYKAIQKAARDRIGFYLHKTATMSMDTMSEIFIDKKVVGKMELEEVGIIKAYQNYIKTGDASFVKIIWDRVLGKAAEFIDLNVNDNATTKMLTAMMTEKNVENIGEHSKK